MPESRVRFIDSQTSQRFIQPCPNLTEHETPYGCISTSWKRDDEGNILYEFDLPECVSATFTPLGDNVTYNGDTIFFAGSHKLKLETATH